MASTYSQLAAVGIKGADSLVTGFAGIAASAEDPKQAMKSLSQQATQMAAKPTVAWQDFKIMMEQTPAGISAVAKEMGMTTQELVANVQDGTVKTEEFFCGGPKGNGWPSETIANTLAPAFEMLSGKGISAVEGIISKVESIDGQALADKIGGWIEQAQPYFDQFKIVAGYVWDALQMCWRLLLGGFFALGIVSSIVGPISSVVGAIGNLGSLPLPKIAANLLGTAAAEEAEGAASATAVGPTLAMAAAFIAMGAGVLLASAGALSHCTGGDSDRRRRASGGCRYGRMVAAIAGLAAGAALLGPALTAGSVGMIAFGGAIVMIGAAIATYGMAAAMGMMMLSSAMLMLTAGAAAASVGLVALTASSVASAAGIAAFGVAATASAAGVVALAGAAKMVASQLKSIDKSSQSASANLSAMVGSVSIVSEGLGALGEKANSAMTTLTNAFTNAASKAQQAGRKVGEGFHKRHEVRTVKSSVGGEECCQFYDQRNEWRYSSAYSAGQRIGKGFVDGLRSQLASVRSIAGEIKAASTMSSASYSMADTNQPASSRELSAESVCINGIWLEDEIEGFRVLSTTGREGSEFFRQLLLRGKQGTAASSSQGRYPEREIIVRYQLIADSSSDFREKYNHLAKLLNVEEVQIIFNDETDKCFTGNSRSNREGRSGNELSHRRVHDSLP
ncbi:unnamed protein product [Cylicocyclus nassatus]|uniref:Tape measure protein N-terminal domain-containing protein n=1 Tax=Cylicocyclus nassatus TaxID=53992 RepID=A0AA36GQP0_CYLNA|nr:unnamed protein product [Cylicocyclus nassatus]